LCWKNEKAVRPSWGKKEKGNRAFNPLNALSHKGKRRKSLAAVCLNWEEAQEQKKSPLNALRSEIFPDNSQGQNLL